MGEFAEEAIIVEEVTAPKRVNHFIEANTQELEENRRSRSAHLRVLEKC